MNELVSAAVQSIVKEKIKHIANGAAGGTAFAVAPDWLGISVGVASLLVASMVFFKTYSEIRVIRLNEQLAKIELAKQGARQSDHS